MPQTVYFDRVATLSAPASFVQLSRLHFGMVSSALSHSAPKPCRLQASCTHARGLGKQNSRHRERKRWRIAAASSCQRLQKRALQCAATPQSLLIAPWTGSPAEQEVRAGVHVRFETVKAVPACTMAASSLFQAKAQPRTASRQGALVPARHAGQMSENTTSIQQIEYHVTAARTWHVTFMLTSANLLIYTHH